jgi:hypothetical protein
MERRTYWTLAALVVSMAVGCSSGSAPAPTATAVAAIPADPAARAAYDFLDAVLKGDTLRASKRLTPIAIERINATGKQFSPPGLQTASFRIGEVRKPTADQALVQCILTDSSQGAPRTEEIGCLLRLVDNDWRVSGIAYIPGPNRPPMILNFENPQQAAVSAQPPMASAGDPAANVDRPSPSPPRTADHAVTPASYR